MTNFIGALNAPGIDIHVCMDSHLALTFHVTAKVDGSIINRSRIIYCNTCPICGKKNFSNNAEHIHHTGFKHPLMKEPLTEASPVAFRVYLVGEKSICVCVDCLKDDDQVDTYSLQVQLNHCPMC